MNLYKTHNFQPPTPHAHGALPQQLASRTSRTEQMVTQVIPVALNAGLKELANMKTATQTAASGAAVATGTAVETAATTAGKSTLWGTTMGVGKMLGGALNVVGGLYGAFQLAANWGSSTPAAGAASGASVGALIGSFFPGPGTAIGAAIGGIAGGLLGAIRSGKHEDQKMRDQVREVLVKTGILDSSFSLNFPDGTVFDMGIDGGPKAELGGRRPFEVDTNNPLAKYAVSWLNPVIELLSQGNTKIQTDFVGYFANAVLTNATSLDDVRSRVDTVLQKFGITNEGLETAIRQSISLGQIPADVGAAYLNGISERVNGTVS